MRIPSEGRGLKEDASGRAGASPNWREVGSIMRFNFECKHYPALLARRPFKDSTAPSTLTRD